MQFETEVTYVVRRVIDAPNQEAANEAAENAAWQDIVDGQLATSVVVKEVVTDPVDAEPSDDGWDPYAGSYVDDGPDDLDWYGHYDESGY